MTKEQIKQDIIDCYGELTHENVWDYCENYGYDYSPSDFGLSDEESFI